MGTFDDLIPDKGKTKGGAFDDLIPEGPAKRDGGGAVKQFFGNIPRGIAGTMDTGEIIANPIGFLVKRGMGQPTYTGQFEASPIAPPKAVTPDERLAATIGDFAGGSIMPGGAWIGAARSMAAQPVKQATSRLGQLLQAAAADTARSPWKAAGFDAASAVTGGTAKHYAEEGGAGPVGQTLAAIAGGMAPAAPSLISATPVGYLGRYLTGRGEAAQAKIGDQRALWQAAGVPEFAPAMTDNAILKATGEGGAGSILGGRLRDRAQESIDNVLGNTRRLINSGTNGEPVSDVAEGLQQTLRGALVERSMPGGAIKSMDDAGLERYTGPVSIEGFSAPKPRVDPIEPVYPPFPAAREVDPNSVKFDAVAPEYVKFPDIKPKYSEIKSVPYPAGMEEVINKQQSALQIATKQVDDLTDQFTAEAQRRGMDPEALWRQMASQEEIAKLGVAIPRDSSHEHFARLIEARNQATAAQTALEQAVRAAEDARVPIWQNIAKQEYRAAHEQAVADHAARVAEAKKAAATKNAQARDEAVAKAKLQAEQEAAAERAAIKARADAEAEAATQRAQAEAEAKWQEDMARAPGFKMGRTRESYPTEFDAAYERIGREMPKMQRNPLGGRGISGSPYKTATEDLMDQFGLEGRRQGLVPGYKEGQPFGEAGGWAYGIGPYIDELVGPDVGRRLDAYAKMRANSQVAPQIQGIRDFRTAIRESAQTAERPPFPGTPRTREAAALHRLEGAVSDDMYRFLNEGGERGQATARMMSNVDKEYSSFIQDLRRPLAKIYGDKVEPVEAMARIVDAVETGNLKTLRAFMRVMTEKGDPKQARTAIVAAMTNNAPTLKAFLAGMAKMPKESRSMVFRGEDGTAMLRQLEALEAIGKRLNPYEKAISGGYRAFGRGPNLANPANLAMGFAAYANWYATFFGVAGAYGVARFMASPRYMNWLTRGARINSKPQLIAHMARLGRFAETDHEKMGQNIISAAKYATDMSARAVIIGENANVDPAQLEGAQKAQDDGANPNDIWKQFGWYRGRDGQWRSEVDDSAAKLKIDRNAFLKVNNAKLGDILDHPPLFAAYPELKDLKITATDKPFGKTPGTYGLYSSKDHAIMINPRAAFEDDGKAWDPVGVILHEIQHAVSGREGFRYGDRVPMYQKRPGEAEAVNVQNRRMLTAEQRKTLHPGRTILPSEDKLDWRPDEDEHYMSRWGAERAKPAIREGGAARQSGQAPSPYQSVIDAAKGRGIDLQKASPQEVIDAAWAARPTDEIAEMIELMAEKYGLTPPWKRKN